MTAATSKDETNVRERLLWLLSAVTFFIFFQAYMVAPIIPRLSVILAEPIQSIGLIVPAYLVPYGVATLVYGFMADRVGLWRIIIGSLGAFAVLTALTATARSVEMLAFWRVLTGLGASGVVPLALVLVGRLYPYERRGRPLGWLFGAMAGGMAFGSTFGAILEPFIGWFGLFLAVGGAAVVLGLLILPYRNFVVGTAQPVTGNFSDPVRGYRLILGTPRGHRTYSYVLLIRFFMPEYSPGSACISSKDMVWGLWVLALPCWAMASRDLSLVRS